MFCSHCGGIHEGICGVVGATERILEKYRPRGMTLRKACPACGRDGTFYWGAGSKYFACDCGAVVPTDWGTDD